MENSCEYIVDFRMEPPGDGDPVLCDKPASIKHGGYWFCAEHYDATIEDESQLPKSPLDNKPFS